MNVSSRYPVQTVCVIRYRNSGCVASGNDIHVQDTTRQSLVNVMPDERTSYNCRVLACDSVDQLSYIKYIDIRTFIS